MADGPLRAVVVGGHPVIRGVVRMACEGVGGTDVVAEVSTLADATRLLGDLAPDLLVVDVDLPDGDGMRLLRDLPSGPGRPRVLVLSGRSDGGRVLEALGLGADGFLSTSEGLRGLTAAIRDVLAGREVVPPDLASRAVADVGRYARQARDSAAVETVLTPRERQVLELLADGLTMQQIGRRLAISPRTVETHVGKLYRKLGVRGRVQAVARGAALGLIDLR
jgi:DNA-binding NarL/FixJ family response regulator